MPKVTSEGVLNVIKSELKNKGKLSSNVFEDVRPAKYIFDNTDNGVIKGFIQEIKSDPFGFLIYCENQVSQ